ERDKVVGLSRCGEAGDMAEDAAMVIPVKIPVEDHVADFVEGAVVDQQAPEHRLLGVDRVRRNPEVQQLGIGGGLRRGLDHGSVDKLSVADFTASYGNAQTKKAA